MPLLVKTPLKMNNIYLNPKLKTYYMEDFNKLIDIDRDFWKIENDFLKDRLLKINSNHNVQTLYSSFESQNQDDWTSYLQFAFTKKVENKIFRVVIPELLIAYNLNDDNECICYYNYYEPEINPNFKNRSEKFGMGCIDDKNYFKINRITIYLETYDNETRQNFWNDLEIALSELE